MSPKEMQKLRVREDEKHGFTHSMFKETAGHVCGNIHQVTGDTVKMVIEIHRFGHI